MCRYTGSQNSMEKILHLLIALSIRNLDTIMAQEKTDKIEKYT